jgi:hypothetical protein
MADGIPADKAHNPSDLAHSAPGSDEVLDMGAFSRRLSKAEYAPLEGRSDLVGSGGS